jgi:hypothetical protein
VEDWIGAGGATGASEAEGGLGESQRATGGERAGLEIGGGLLSMKAPPNFPLSR